MNTFLYHSLEDTGEMVVETEGVHAGPHDRILETAP